jgi:hypothetical protein
MIYSLRPFLVSFLVLLQFIAPLVHAHTGEKVLSQGLHVPGLEVYAHATNETVSNDVFPCKTGGFCSNIDGQVVGVDTGVHREMAIATQRLYKKITTDVDHGYCLPQISTTFKTAFSVFFTTLNILAVPLPIQPGYDVHSPRAPPSQA